ncbi:MAG: hypothetical protein ABL949_00400 [Fimbriimonadaceae bacterium]
MVTRDRIWGAIAVTVLSCPLSCAFAGGLVLSHDARKTPSQEPWQAPFAFALATAGIVAAFVCIALLQIVFKGYQRNRASLLVRIAAVNPLVGGSAMVGTGMVSGTGGGAALMLLGLALIGLGIGLVTTNELPDVVATPADSVASERNTPSGEEGDKP